MTTIESLKLRARDRHEGDDALVPAVSPYRFRAGLLEELGHALEMDANVLFIGPPGSGKTSLPMQVAARHGQPCLRFNLNGETRVHHLRGQQRPQALEGVLTLGYHYGGLVDAMRKGHWVVLDELDAAPPNVLFALQPVLEEGARTIDIPETGETVHAHPVFRVFATANTIGVRAVSRARHAGTSPMNSALVDRFSMLLEVGYPSRVEEAEIVMLHARQLASTPEGRLIIEGLTRVAEKLRESPRFSADFSMRRTIQWARLVERFPVADAKTKRELPWDVLRAAKLSVLRKFESPLDYKVAYEMVCRTFEYPVDTHPPHPTQAP